MKKFAAIFFMIVFSVFLCGCTRKNMTMSEFIPIVRNGTPQEVSAAIKNIKDINEKFYLEPAQQNIPPIEYDIITIAAASTKYPEVIDILAKNGAEINNEDAIGKTPLVTAFSYNPNPEIFKAIIKNGGTPYAQKDLEGKPIKIDKSEIDNYYKSVVTEVMWNSNPEVLRELLKFEEYKKAAKENEWFMFMFVCWNPENTEEIEEEKVKILIENGLDINAKRKFKLYPDGITNVDRLRLNKNLPERKKMALKILEKYTN